jgi:class 3 adenylate cyclase
MAPRELADGAQFPPYTPGSMPPETRYAPCGDLRIAYQVSGSGTSDLVLAPGTASHLDLDWEWPARRRFYERLGRFCRLIRFDKRGTGMSDRPGGVATLEERIEDIRAVMDSAGSDCAFLFGVSEGGSMVSLFAATVPERTRGLLIWGCQARWIRTEDYPWGMTADEHARSLAELGEKGVTEDYLVGAGAGLGPQADRAYIDWFLRYARAGASPGALRALEEANAQIDLREVLPAVKVPALVMNREGDPVASCDAALDLARRIPGARFVSFPGDTHSMFTLEPEQVLATIEEFVTGTKPVLAGDRVLLTLLFADIVSSTERAIDAGDASWRDLLERFHELSLREVEGFGGGVVDTAGDGLLATFEGPVRAIRAAHVLQETAAGLHLRLRSGIHTGEVERAGDAVRGFAVHVAARVCAAAAPGQVIVTSTVKDLVAGSGIAFDDVGVHKLKGVPEARPLYAVRQ